MKRRLDSWKMTKAKAGRGWLGSEKPPQLAAGEKAIGDGSPPRCAMR